MKIGRFEDIDAWQAGRIVVKKSFQMTSDWPPKYRGLADQIHRAAVSITANIAEGFDATSDADFVRFLKYSRQSATELQSHKYSALDLSLITDDEFRSMSDHCITTKKLIGGFIRYLSTQKQPIVSDSIQEPDSGLRT